MQRGRDLSEHMEIRPPAHLMKVPGHSCARPTALRVNPVTPDIFALCPHPCKRDQA